MHAYFVRSAIAIIAKATVPPYTANLVMGEALARKAVCWLNLMTPMSVRDRYRKSARGMMLKRISKMSLAMGTP